MRPRRSTTRPGALGRGLEALLGAAARPDAPPPGGQSAEPAGTIELGVAQLRPGRYQPRQHLAEEGLAELADSIREQGVLQPLLVRIIEPAPEHSGEKAYEIVAGERRWRAAMLAGLTRVPVIVRELDDRSALAVALIENLQREDLNPIDQARSLSRLTEEFGMTHEQVAKAVGRSRAAVSNLLRLLDLSDEVRTLLADGKIEMGHARALLPLDPQRQVAMARRTARRGLSVRQVEKAVRAALCTAAKTAPNPDIDLQARWLERQIAEALGQRLAIRPARGGYTLRIAFGDLGELQAALRKIDELVGKVRETAGPRARDAARKS